MPVSDKRIRILTVDDHPRLRDGIAALIEGQPDSFRVYSSRAGCTVLPPWLGLALNVGISVAPELR